MRFVVLIDFGASRVEHRVKAGSAGEAEDRVLRAYPKRQIVDVRVTRVAE